MDDLVYTEDRASFEVTANVTREPYIGTKFARIYTKVKDARGREVYLEVVSFAPDRVSWVATGDRIAVRGRIGTRKLDNVKKLAADGREFDIWQVQLIAETIERVGGDDDGGGVRKPKASKTAPQDETDIPF